MKVQGVFTVDEVVGTFVLQSYINRVSYQLFVNVIRLQLFPEIKQPGAKPTCTYVCPDGSRLNFNVSIILMRFSLIKRYISGLKIRSIHKLIMPRSKLLALKSIIEFHFCSVQNTLPSSAIWARRK